MQEDGLLLAQREDLLVQEEDPFLAQEEDEEWSPQNLKMPKIVFSQNRLGTFGVSFAIIIGTSRFRGSVFCFKKGFDV